MRPAAIYAKPSEHDQVELLALLHRQWRVAARALMVLLWLQGWSATAIAELLGDHPRTVRRWIQRFNQEGSVALALAAVLADRPRSGRLGWAASGWASGSGICSPPSSGPGRCRCGTSTWANRRCGCGRCTAGSARSPAGGGPAWSPRAIPTTTSAAPSCARRSPRCLVVRWCSPEDEPHVNLLPWVRSTWTVPGCRRQVVPPGTNRRRSIVGAVDLASGRFLSLIAAKAVSSTFIAFVAPVAAASPAAPQIVLVVDNLPAHRSKQVQAWLAGHPRVRRLSAARSSPHDNPVERVWGALKAYLANRPTQTMAGRLRQVHACFRHRTSEQILQTAAPSSSPWPPDGYGHNNQEVA